MTAGAAAQTTATDAVEPEPPIIIDAENSVADLRSGITRMTDRVEIQRGAMLVIADAGAMYQENGSPVKVELTGNPVTWRDRLDDGTLINGEALMIVFEIDENIITLTGNARLTHDQGEFTGDELTYDLDTENLVGRSDEGNRVRMVIEPEAVLQADDKANGNDNGRAPPPSAPETAPQTDASAPPADEPAEEATEPPPEPPEAR